MDGESKLDQQLAALLASRQSRNQLRRLTHFPKGHADFSSNGYLSLSSHPAVQESYLALLRSHAGAAGAVGTIPPHGFGLLGSGGSRLLDGNSAQAEALERAIAGFHGAPAGLLFNSAMDANVGLFGCVPQPGDAVVFDELIHASVHDGLRLSRAGRRVAFAHNRIYSRAAGGTADDGDVGSGEGTEDAPSALRSLEEVLRELQDGPGGCLIRGGEGNVFVAVEGVYSMDGDLAPLRAIVDCVESCLPRGNGYIIVDEAHSTGIFGPRGRGLVCELGLEDRIWARVHGFGKAMGCAGGIILCSQTTRAYLINYARSLIYTTAMAFTSLASIEVTYDFIRSGQAVPLVSRLGELTRLAHAVLHSICLRHRPSPALLRVNAGTPKSPIIPLFTSRPRSLADYCQRRGFIVRPVVAPTVPRGRERVRICLHAGNTLNEIEGFGKAVEAWLLSQRIDEAARKNTADTGQRPLEEASTEIKAGKARL